MFKFKQIDGEKKKEKNEKRENFEFLFQISAAIGVRAIATSYAGYFENRVEFNSPFYSFNQLNDGVALFEDGFDPYATNKFNMPPLSLHFLSLLNKHLPNMLTSIWIILDVLTAVILEKSGGSFLVYAFNPLSIISCGIFSLTVLQNFLVALMFLAFRNDHLKIYAILIGFWSSFTLYPFILISTLGCSKNHNMFFLVSLTISSFCLTNLANFAINGFDWSYLEAVYSVILNFTDIQPNVGLHWYFFVQVFEHFRVFYTMSFTILYFFIAIPLSFIIRNEPNMHFIATLFVISTFFPYPTLNQTTLAFALLPVLADYRKYFRYTLLVPATLVTSIALMPVMWHMWIVSSSGNANFFFGATLTYNVALIYLIMDLLFVYSRRQIDLIHGDSIKKQAKFGYSFY